MPISLFIEFIKKESAGGILLFLAALVAIVAQNTSLAPLVHSFLHTEISLGLLSLSLHHWVNDLLMAIFFLVVGLEIKREVVLGTLSSPAKLALPLCAALGGMIAPALVYYGTTHAHPELVRGWAIPAATDIAFALGVLSLFGKRIPVSIKILLTAIAVIDDLGAILVIAFFYTAQLSLMPLFLAVCIGALLFLLHRRRIQHLFPYLLLGIFFWYFIYRSGIHATIAGVLLAFAIPLTRTDTDTSNAPPPLERLMHILHPWVVYAILPLFSFCNAGVALPENILQAVTHPLSLGIALGLFLGKQLGVFGALLLAIRLQVAPRLEGISWGQLFALSVITGIGFTMSLFIGSLAFPEEALSEYVRMGVILGSLCSCGIGAILLHRAFPSTETTPSSVQLEE